MNLLQKAPTLITVAVLAGIFASLERRIPTPRSKYWKIAWTLVFIHFLAQGFEPASGQENHFLDALDWGALQASAVFFLASASRIVEDRVKRIWLLVVLGVPSIGFAILGAYDVKQPWVFASCLAACFVGGTGFLLWVERRISRAVVLLSIILIPISVWAIRAALHGSLDPGGKCFWGLVLLFRA